jgi:hypothetical protein
MIASHVPAPTRTPRHHLVLATAAAGLTAVIAVAAVSMADPARAAGPPDVRLGTAAQFSVLAGDGVTNTGPTTVTGLVGSFATTTVTDNGAISPPGNVRRGPDGVVSGAKADLLIGYGQAAGAQTSTTALGPDIGGQTLVGGTYNRAGSLDFTGTLTLDGENDPSSVFIIQVGQDFTTATGAQVLLTRGAQACRVYWQIGNDAVVEVDTAFQGTILAGNDISAKTRATFQGRLLSNDGAVTLDTNTITVPTCAAATTTPPPTSATTAPATPRPSATVRPTPRPTKSTGSGGRGDGGGSSDGGSSDSDGSGGDADGTDGDGGASDGADGGFDADAGSSTTTSGIPDAGGPPMFLAPVGAVAVLAGAGLVLASRRRQRGTHRS